MGQIPQNQHELRFWATVCETVRPVLSERRPVLSVLSCLPVCNVGVLWPNGWMDQDETWHGDRPRSRPHCVTWKPSPARSFRLMVIVAKGRPSQLLLSSCTFGPRRNVSRRKDHIPLRYPGRRPVASWNLAYHALFSSLAAN